MPVVIQFRRGFQILIQKHLILVLFSFSIHNEVAVYSILGFPGTELLIYLGLIMIFYESFMPARK